MSRLTRAAGGNNYYLSDDDKIRHDAGGYTGEAVNKLARFENLYEDLLARQNDIAKEMEALRLRTKHAHSNSSSCSPTNSPTVIF